jgi:hypothetical protein
MNLKTSYAGWCYLEYHLEYQLRPQVKKDTYWKGVKRLVGNEMGKANTILKGARYKQRRSGTLWNKGGHRAMMDGLYYFPWEPQGETGS